MSQPLREIRTEMDTNKEEKHIERGQTAMRLGDSCVIYKGSSPGNVPWYTVETNAQNREIDENRKKTREILRISQRAIAFAERDIRCSTTAPQGFPESEWRHIFRGEAVNLDIIFSNLHHIAPPKENVGRIGRTEISLGSTDPARKVQTSGDWTAAWNATVKATAYAFPHRADELRQWGDYLSSEFSAGQASAHQKLIADRNKFSYLYSAFLLPDGIQTGSISVGRQGDRARSTTADIC